MQKKQISSVGVAFAMSLTSLLPALAQGDPVPGPGPAPAPTPTVTSVQTQQPSALQTLFQNIQQQQQLQNIFNPTQFPLYMQANPAISPLDQRSGLTNNANSVGNTKNPQSSLGLTQGTPTIGNSQLLNNPWLAQKNFGNELALRFGGPNASSLFDLLFLATNGQPSGLTSAQLDRVPTTVLLGALLGLARANNLPISDSLLSLMEMLKSNPSTLDLLRPTLLHLANGIASGTMSKQTLLSALSFLTNPQVMNGFVAGAQSATSVGKNASQVELSKQMADQLKQAALGITPSYKPVSTPASNLFFGSTNMSAFSQNIALTNAMQAFTNTLNAAINGGRTTTSTTSTPSTTATNSSATTTAQTEKPTVNSSVQPANTSTPTTSATTTSATAGTSINIQGVTGVNLQSMDLETAMMTLQSNRANLLEGQLAKQMQDVKARNDQMVKLNEQLGDLNKQKSDAQAKKDWAKVGELQTKIDQLKGEINTLASSQQMDMLRMQSLTNKRNEAFDLMTNFIKKMQDSRSSILGNMR